MLTRFSEFDPSFSMLDELRRHFDRMLEDAERGPLARTVARTFPRANLFDRGGELVLTAEVPGFDEKDVTLTLNGDVLTLRGERKVTPPEGYSSHRRERESFKLSRSFSLPCKVDAEKTSAVVKDGVLTVTLAKAAEAQPRQIAVKTAS